MPRERHISVDYHLPVSIDVAGNMRDHGSPLTTLARLGERECREQLKASWRELRNPANRRLAKFILAKNGLAITEHEKNEYSLTLWSASKKISLMAPQSGKLKSQVRFPFDAVAGLYEFLDYFGGVTDCTASSRFLTLSSVRMMWFADEGSAWGNVQPWDGSLVFYQGGAGDVLIARPDGAIGKWHHEFAWPESPDEHRQKVRKVIASLKKAMPGIEVDESTFFPGGPLQECPVLDLECSFGKLVDEFIRYCDLPENSKQKAKMPFYY